MESPNNGHVGQMASVRCRELSASRKLVHNFIKLHNIHKFKCSFTFIKVEEFIREIKLN